MKGIPMQSHTASRFLIALPNVAMVLMVYRGQLQPAAGAFVSGVYQTLPGTTVEERGDRVPNKSRIIPLSATLTFDLEATPPSLTAVIADAVLEGGDPFPLT